MEKPDERLDSSVCFKIRRPTSAATVFHFRSPPGRAATDDRRRSTNVDKKQIERFLAVVDHRSMTAAAKALFLNQASVSASIRELEVQVGTELFRRGEKRCLLYTSDAADD